MCEILCITHKYPPAIGGMERQSYELTNGLKQYYKTHVIAYDDNSNKTLWFAKLRRRVKKFLKGHPNIKLIHLNDGGMGVACLWLQKLPHVPVIVTYHGLDITFPLGVYQQKIVPKLVEFAGAICVSSFTRNECIKRNFSEHTTFTVPNGVDTSLKDIPFNREETINRLKNVYGVNVEGKHIVMSSGRPALRKGFSWFIRNVMPKLNSDVIFLMTGPMEDDRPFISNCISLLPEKSKHKVELFLGTASDTKNIQELLKTTPNIYHLGGVPYNDLMQVFSLADLFVMPNIHVEGDEEGFGLVALEASIRGTYVLASNMEGITEAVIDGKNGSLMPPEDAEAWANKIEELLNNKPRLETMAREGQAFTDENFCWDKMVLGYKAVFDKTIHSPKE